MIDIIVIVILMYALHVKIKYHDTHSIPWYMEGGEKRPLAAGRAKSGRRLAKLWPEEKSGSNRIVDQLMFIPPTGGPLFFGRLKFHTSGCWLYFLSFM